MSRAGIIEYIQTAQSVPWSFWASLPLQAPAKDTMHRVYAATIWSAITVMLVGLSLLFGFWAVLAVGGGVGLAGAVLYFRK